MKYFFFLHKNNLSEKTRISDLTEMMKFGNVIKEFGGCVGSKEDVLAT